MLWEPIEDLQSDWKNLASSELPPVCTACAYHRDDSEEDKSNISDIESLTDSPFQFSYADEEDNLIERFKQWLEDVILTGLEYWNKSI